PGDAYLSVPDQRKQQHHQGQDPWKNLWHRARKGIAPMRTKGLHHSGIRANQANRIDNVLASPMRQAITARPARRQGVLPGPQPLGPTAGHAGAITIQIRSIASSSVGNRHIPETSGEEAPPPRIEYTRSGSRYGPQARARPLVRDTGVQC